MTKKTGLIWTDPKIIFDPTHMVGARPIREADRAKPEARAIRGRW